MAAFYQKFLRKHLDLSPLSVMRQEDNDPYFCTPKGASIFGWAGGIGSMLADIFLGYAHYAPGTLVIKGVMALVAALMYEKMGRTATSRIAGGVVSEIIMVLGYFGYASLLLGKGLAAAASIPGNIFQGAVGLVVGVVLVTVLERAKVTEKLAA